MFAVPAMTPAAPSASADRSRLSQPTNVEMTSPWLWISAADWAMSTVVFLM